MSALNTPLHPQSFAFSLDFFVRSYKRGEIIGSIPVESRTSSLDYALRLMLVIDVKLKTE